MSKQEAAQAFKEAVGRINHGHLTAADIAVMSDNMLEALRLVGRYSPDETVKMVAGMARDSRSLAALEGLLAGVLQDTSSSGQPSPAALKAVIEARLELLKTMQTEEAANPKPDFSSTPRITAKERADTPPKARFRP